MAGNGKQIDPELVDSSRYLTDRLCGIGVERYAVLSRDACALFDRLNRTGLVVRVHHANENGVTGDDATDIIGIDEAGVVDRQVGDTRSLPLQKLAWDQDRGVLNLCRDDVCGSIAPCKERPLEGEVVCFAATTGEDDFLGAARQEACHAFAARFHHPLCRRPGPVRARWIAVTVIHCRAHRFRHARIDGRSCVKIQIDLSHWSQEHDFAHGEGCRSELMHHAAPGTFYELAVRESAGIHAISTQPGVVKTVNTPV